jgi:NAD(P)-dependent dehydrogenase (short-subunit alcohol dehydrogenase family)
LAAETVVITGAAGGIGEALALRFAAAGRRVAVLDVDETGAQRVAAELEAQGTPALGLGCDVTVADDCRAAIAAVTRAWGGVDLLVNNAGITHLGRFRDTAPDVIRRVMEVNFFGAVEMTRAALPSLLQRRGAVVVLSSVAGFAPLATRTGYAASKHALQGFFDSLREEHRRDGLRVLLVCPSFVDTRIGDHALGADGGPAPAGARTGVQRAIPPERVAAAIERALERGRDLLLVPNEARLAWWVSRLAPRLYARLMARRVLAEG